MSFFDAFYIIFKNNSDEVIKANQKIDKSSKETAEQLKNTNEQAEKLGKNFVKVVENATEALAAVLSFGAIKAGVMDAAKFNSNLEVQGKLMGQNVQDIKAYGAAVEAAGGSVEGFQSALQSAFSAASNAGLPLPPVDVLMQRYHDAIKGLSKNEQNRRLGQLGVTDPGMQSLLEQSDEEFAKSIASAREHARVTEQDAAAAREFEKALTAAGQSMGQLFTSIGTDVLPAFTSMIALFTSFTDSLRDNKVGMYEFFGGMIALAISAAGAVGKLTASILTMNSAAGAGILAKIAGKAGAIGGIVLGSSVAADVLVDGSDWLGHKLNQWRGRESTGARTPPANAPGGGAQDAMAFWMSQGYSRAQAAGIVANEQAESTGNPNARGDKGTAVGLYQWHADRVKKIYDATGIDVRTASAQKQREAAAWELEHSGVGAQLRQTDDPNAAGALISRKYESPLAADYEAAKRGQAALAIASNSAFNTAGGAAAGGAGGAGGAGDKTVNVKVDAINVHTQATDAAAISGAIGDAFTSHMRTTVANFDDGTEA